MILPQGTIKRLMKEAGAERVNDDAAKALASELEVIGKKIAKDAFAAAKHAGRKTVSEDDIRLVMATGGYHR